MATTKKPASKQVVKPTAVTVKVVKQPGAPGQTQTTIKNPAKIEIKLDKVTLPKPPVKVESKSTVVSPPVKTPVAVKTQTVQKPIAKPNPKPLVTVEKVLDKVMKDTQAKMIATMPTPKVVAKPAIKPMVQPKVLPAKTAPAKKPKFVIKKEKTAAELKVDNSKLLEKMQDNIGKTLSS